MIKNNLFDKRKILLVFTFLFFTISAYFVSAHFVCGVVQNSPNNVSSAWMSVRVFYPSNSSQFTSCQVSPQDNKYCCDSEAIPGKTWKIGDVVSAEVYEPGSGYFAGPVSVVTTGDGYDLFPEMQIKKAIEIYSPQKHFFISNNSEVFLNLSLTNPFNSINISNDSGNFVLCSNCSGFSGNVSVSFGTNSWNLIASDGIQNFNGQINFTILKEVNFSRYLQCVGCKGNSIHQNKGINISLNFNLSSNISNVELDEFVPVDFEIINTTGILENYSSTHNVIRWNISGNEGKVTYLIKAPKVSFFGNSKVYLFKTELGGEIVNQDNLTVKNFFNIFPSPEPEQERHVYGVIYSSIGPGNPYVIHNQGDIQNIAFYPNRTINNSVFNVSETSNPFKEAWKTFLINSNVNPILLDKIYLDMKINKSDFKNSSDLSVYADDGGWKKQNVTFYKDSVGNVHLKGFINGNAFAIVNSESKNSYERFYSNLRNLFKMRLLPSPIIGLTF